MKFRSPVTRELRPYRGAGVPRPADAGDAFYVTYPFAQRSDGFHGGLDIGNGRIGYPLVAVGAGTVIAVGFLGQPWSTPTIKYASGNYGGLMAVVEHAPGVVSIYAHMRRVLVARNQILSAGQQIGEIGDSGSAIGQAHVHFGIQAPAASVPAGVATHATTAGYGLDVDPWPLITGAAALNIEGDDDVKLLPGLRHLVQGVIGTGNNLRRLPTTDSEARYIKPEEGDAKVAFFGVIPDQGPYVIGGKPGTDWAMVGAYGEVWYVARPLVTTPALTGTGAETVPAQDCSALENKIDSIATAAVGAGQAIVAIQGLAKR